MIKYLEEILREKTKDSESEILLAQWNYDKKVIPAALQSVSNLFPHYSLHDETHSITIINNIVRVLGKENLHKLSAIDIWLILEASYSHDIGMVVSSEKLLESLKSPKFLDFFKELIQDTKNGLHEFAAQFQVIDNKIHQKDNLLNLNLNDGIKFILAEYFRRIHAERSEEIINNPISEISLSSPRSVIPPRIFKMLRFLTYYKNQKAENHFHFNFLEFTVNIHTEKASEVLTLNRNKIKDEFQDKFIKEFLLSAYKMIIENFDTKFLTEQEKSSASMFLNYYYSYYNDELKEFDVRGFNQWENFKISIGENTDIELLTLLNSVNTIKIINDFGINRQYGDVYELQGDELTLNLHAGSASYDYTKFFLNKVSEHFKSISIIKEASPGSDMVSKVILVTKESKKSAISKDNIFGIVKRLKDEHSFSARAIIPCLEDFLDLRIKDDAYEIYVNQYNFSNNVFIPFPKMLAPFVREEINNKRMLKVVINDKVIDWVYKNRFNSDVSKELIKEKYKSFCEMINLEEINKGS